MMLLPSPAAQRQLSARRSDALHGAGVGGRVRHARPAGRAAAGQRRSGTAPCAVMAPAPPVAALEGGDVGGSVRAPKVVVAGGGIGGLIAAIACKNRGMDVTCFERVTKYRPFGGPIQLAGNALGALESIDRKVAERVFAEGTITGDRLNGLLDGRTGEWYVRFDTRKPAHARGLPLTLVVNRYTLLDILVDRCRELGAEVLHQGREVASYSHAADGRVHVRLTDGSSAEADVLVGADGIHSKVRQQMKGPGDRPVYSGYTCFTGTCDFEAADVDTVGYQVFLGCSQYFVCSDLGGGRTQWYAFHAREPGSADEEDKKAALAALFDGWCAPVTTRIAATPLEAIERRDIWDHRPTFRWADGNVALLGDAAHAMQPNMGQGGCQAIEDAYILARELQAAATAGGSGGWAGDARLLKPALGAYERQRVPRAAAVQGFARSAALMASTYRPYLGSSPYGFYRFIPGMSKLWQATEAARVPHPGRVVGQVGMMATIDTILDYIAGGCPVGSDERAPYCQVPGVSPAVPKRPTVTDEVFQMKGVPGFAR